MRTTASNPSKGSTLRVSKTPSPTLCSQRMTPPVRPVIDILPFEGAPVLVASIPELVPKQKPCYVSASGCYGGSYVRVGDGDRKLSGYEIDRLISEHAQPRFDDAIVGEATRDDLDAALVAGMLERERSMHPRNLGALSDETVLRKLPRPQNRRLRNFATDRGRPGGARHVSARVLPPVGRFVHLLSRRHQNRGAAGRTALRRLVHLHRAHSRHGGRRRGRRH